MDSSLKMSVSPICKNDNGDKYAFVSFTDGTKTIEVKIPDCKIVYNKGFDENASEEVMEYVLENIGKIKRMASETNVFSAMIK